MAKIVIDGITYEVNPDNNLLQECLSQGLDLPYFCWHPCMGSVGACRQCAVKQYRDADDKEGILVMACMTPASDGSIISLEDEQAKSFRSSVIESLMISHPHDCPVCEEGGECHLQDMTQMSGHNYRRFDKKKVTHRNQYLGPFINHEMNRCITCYRCVRYYDDYAGGTDLSAQASHHHTYFGRYEEGVLESEFSGNLVEVCPTGVFTDKGFSENYTRKWDLQVAPSVCVGCSVGCNISPGERYGNLRRIVNRYNSEVNGYFLCDRGRFSFDYVNSSERLQHAVQQIDGDISPIDADQLKTKMAELESSQVIGIGSPRASNEANFSLRCLVGEENFYAGYCDAEHEAMQLMLRLHADKAFNSPSVRDIEQADAIIVIGEDITNVAPRLALALRQSVRNKAKQLADESRIPQWQDAAVRELAQNERSPLCLLSHQASRLDDIASDILIDSSAQLANVGFTIANRISNQAPAASKAPAASNKETAEADEEMVRRVAEQLSTAKRPLVIAGSSQGSLALIRAAANIATALNDKLGQPIDLCLVVPEVNSVGMGMLTLPENNLGSALVKLGNGVVKNVIVLENDLYRRAASADVNTALNNAENVIAIDLLPNSTTAKANIVLPSTAFSEQESSYINYEGRAQLSYQVHRNPSEAKPAWRWLSHEDDGDIESMVNRCSAEAKGFDRLAELLPDPDQFIAGMKIPRQSQRYSGRTAMRAHLDVHEPKQPVDLESAMSFSMEGIPSQKDATLLASSWSPRWNSNQAISKFQEEVNGELKQGHTGCLLIEKTDLSVGYFDGNEAEGPTLDSRLQLAFAQQIYGSDELSARSNAIQQRMTDAFASISPADAQARGLKQGDRVILGSSKASAQLCIRDKIRTGTLLVYCGAQINPHNLEASITLTKDTATVTNSGRGLTGLIVSDLYEEGH